MGMEVLEGLHVSQSQQRGAHSPGKSINGSIPIPLFTNAASDSPRFSDFDLWQLGKPYTTNLPGFVFRRKYLPLQHNAAALLVFLQYVRVKKQAAASEAKHFPFTFLPTLTGNRSLLSVDSHFIEKPQGIPKSINHVVVHYFYRFSP